MDSRPDVTDDDRQFREHRSPDVLASCPNLSRPDPVSSPGSFLLRQISHLERFQTAPQPQSTHRFRPLALSSGFHTAGFMIESLVLYWSQAGMVELADTQVLGACAS